MRRARFSRQGLARERALQQGATTGSEGPGARRALRRGPERRLERRSAGSARPDPSRRDDDGRHRRRSARLGLRLGALRLQRGLGQARRHQVALRGLLPAHHGAVPAPDRHPGGPQPRPRPAGAPRGAQPILRRRVLHVHAQANLRRRVRLTAHRPPPAGAVHDDRRRDVRGDAAGVRVGPHDRPAVRRGGVLRDLLRHLRDGRRRLARPAVRGGPAARDVDAGDRDAGEVRRVVRRDGAVHPAPRGGPRAGVHLRRGIVRVGRRSRSRESRRGTRSSFTSRRGALARGTPGARHAARVRGSRVRGSGVQGSGV